MKNLLWVASAAFLISCQAAPQPSSDPAAPSAKDASYAFGELVGNSLKATNVKVDYDAFVAGMKDVIEKNAPKVPFETANETIQNAIAAATKKKGEENAAAEVKFLAENGKKAGVTTTASGLQYEVLAQGTGPKPVGSDMVKVDYEGKLLDGTVFDSSIERKTPAEFQVDGVIPGWSEAIQLMNVGSKFRLTVPSALAYGENGAGGKIGPNATLIFDVTLISIEKGEAQAK